MLPLTSCDHDKKKEEPKSNEITTKNVEKALEDAEFKKVFSEEKVLVDAVNFYYEIAPSKPNSLKIKDEDVEITRIEFYFDDKLISTSYNEPYSVESKQIGLSSSVNHKLVARIYGETNPKNAAHIDFDVASFDLSKVVNWYDDSNLVGQGDTYNISVHLDPEKSAKGVTITSFTAYLGRTLMGICTSEPFALSHIVTEPTGTELDVKMEVKFSNGVTEYKYSRIEVCDPNVPTTSNQILSGSKEFKQSEVLRCKAQAYTGKDSKWDVSFTAYLDEVEIASSKTFPFYYEKSLQSISKGMHILKYRWGYLDSNGNEKYSYSTEDKITVK
ncbi:MAG: hypothetical protein K2K82_03840 [Muribaculaceae bacterium]|nr:hypothetical protein [Muribaculaceae bacterium]